MDNYDIGYNDGYFAGLSKKQERTDRLIKIEKDISYHEGYSKGLLDAKNNQPKNNISINYPPLDWTDEIEEQ